MLQDGETEPQATSLEFTRKLLQPHGEENTPLRRSRVYTFHARMADRWRDGRIFLAGDAAHLTPPFAGQGMNSGIRDAHNLAWKLAAVLQGRLGAGLLDTYEQERRKHAWEMILLALRMGRVMMPRSSWSAFGLQAAFRLLHIVPPARSYFAEMKYKPKPRFERGFLARGHKDGASPLIGRLCPQPAVRSADRTALLDEFLGKGFALLALPHSPPSLLDRLPADLWPPLEVRRIAIQIAGDSTPVPAGVTRLSDVEGNFSRSMRGVPQGLVLVRPDRYVAAHLSANHLEAGIGEVSTLIAQTWN
jgi:3-(3-hydroxy-phenyl)propionate hydroxylase